MAHHPHAHPVSSAAGSNSWVSVKTHRSIGDAVGHLKAQGMQILATHLSARAVDFREVDYTRPTCVLLGEEKPASPKKRWRWPIRTSSFR